MGCAQSVYVKRGYPICRERVEAAVAESQAPFSTAERELHDLSVARIDDNVPALVRAGRGRGSRLTAGARRGRRVVWISVRAVDGQAKDVLAGDALGERVGRDARLGLRGRLLDARDAAALEALVDAQDDVVGDQVLEVRDVFDAEAAERRADDVRGQAEDCAARSATVALPRAEKGAGKTTYSAGRSAARQGPRR
jgi:hypothetical protein